MKIRIEKLCLGDACNLNLNLETKGATLLYDTSEISSAAVLKSLVDPEAISEGGIFLDDLPLETYYEKHLIPETFGYVFDAAIMLSNLSIRENLYLPFKIRYQNHESDT
jgi:ABC-type ATPase involved in cell division